jgi:hypothetical protein
MRLKLSYSILPIFFLLTTIAVAGAGTPRGAAAGTTFNPHLAASVTDPTAGTASDFHVTFNLDKGDVNFAAVVIYMPSAWQSTPAAAIPINARVGTLDAHATLGLINGPCNNTFPASFDLRNASTDANHTVSFFDLNGDGIQDFAQDRDGNGVLDGIDHRPDFDSRILPGLHEIARSTGIIYVAGIPVILQFLVFAPGTVIFQGVTGDPALGFPTVTLLENIGDPAAIPAPFVITDFCTPLTSQLTFFGMTPDGQQTLFRNPAQAGTYTFTAIALGQPDADADGIENSLDTCTLLVNVGDPRVLNSGDADGDGLDAACDPHDSPDAFTFGDVDCNHTLTIGDAQKIARKLVNLPVSQSPGCTGIGALAAGVTFGDVDCNNALTIGDAQKIARTLIHLTAAQVAGCSPIGLEETGTNTDQDLDGYLNRQDNCPLIPNGQDLGNNTQADTDRDFIGNACDPNPTTPDGASTPSITTSDVHITG